MNQACSRGLFFLLVIILAGFFCQFLLRFILVYRFEEKGLAAVYFGFLYALFIKYEEIENIRVIPLRDSLWRGGFMTVRAGNRLTGPVLAFSRNKGFMREFFLTPDDAVIFAEELKKRVEKAIMTSR